MDVEKNLRLFETIEKAMSVRDWAVFRESHLGSVVVYSPTTPEPTKGIDEHVGAVEGLITAFPDMRMKVEHSFGQGDWACVELLMTGTHKGPLKGPNGQTIPATNKQIRLPFTSVVRFEGGKIAEEHNYYDRLDMLSQLGVQPKD